MRGRKRRGGLIQQVKALPLNLKSLSAAEGAGVKVPLPQGKASLGELWCSSEVRAGTTLKEGVTKGLQK